LTSKLIEELNLQDLCVLGGRDKVKVEKIAKKHNFKSTSAFSLDLGKNQLDDQLRRLNVCAVLHCAGPFEKTAHTMIDACLRNDLHYLDITGEIQVFEYSLSNNQMNKSAESKRIVIMSGVGFDVVPTDCLSLALTDEFKKKFHNSPHYLELAISFGNSPASHGTLKTMILGVGKPEPIRRNGKLLEGKKFHTIKKVRFPRTNKELDAVTVPWGDVSTAYHSTGVPNINVLFATRAPPPLFVWIINFFLVHWFLILLFKIPIVFSIISKAVEKLTPRGLTDDQRTSHKGIQIVGFVQDESGSKRVSGHVFTTEGYTFTADAALLSTLRVMAGQVNKYGCITPSVAFGSQFVTEIPKCELSIDQK
jgi:short subunit dehydrogenase-like uncharacterized protein